MLTRLVLALVVAGSALTACDTGPDFSAAAARIERAVEEIPLDGASLAVVEDGETIHRQVFGGYGFATQVSIASASKWLTGATIMTMVDDGLVDLGDHVSRYLPRFTGAKAAITIRQLMSHTSGLPRDHPCLGDRTLTLAECVDRIATVRLVAAPGSQFRYGGVSMQVAGRVAEVVTGQPWAELFAERITGPLGTGATRFQVGNPTMAGGARSTLGDYTRFVTMLLDRGVYGSTRVLSAAAVAEMERDQTGGAPIVVASPGRKAEGTTYGIGVWRDAVGPRGTAFEVSSPGAFGFLPWVDRRRDVAGVFMIEDRSRRRGGLGAGVRSDVARAIDG